MPRRRSGTADLADYELAWVVREVAKITDKPFREIGEELANDMLANEDSLSEYDYTLGSKRRRNAGDALAQGRAMETRAGRGAGIEANPTGSRGGNECPRTRKLTRRGAHRGCREGLR